MKCISWLLTSAFLLIFIFNSEGKNPKGSNSNFNIPDRKTHSKIFSENITFCLDATSYNFYNHRHPYVVKAYPGWGGSLRGGRLLKHNTLFYVEIGFAVNKLNEELFKESCLKRAHSSDYTIVYEPSYSHKARLSTISISFEYAKRINFKLMSVEPFVKLKGSVFNSRIGSFVYRIDSSGINNNFYNAEYSRSNLSVIPTFGINVNKKITGNCYLVTSIETGYVIGQHHLAEDINIPNVSHSIYKTGISTPHIATRCAVGIMVESAQKNK